MLAMSLETKVQEAVVETFDEFHISYLNDRTGTDLEVPLEYFMVAPDFLPGSTITHGGKQSPRFYQDVFDEMVFRCIEQKVDVRITTEEQLRMKLARWNLGIDCSNFVYRSLTAVYEGLGLGDYAEDVFWNADNLLINIDKGKIRHGARTQRPVNKEEHKQIVSCIDGSDRTIAVAAITRILGKDGPQYLTSAEHMTKSAKPLRKDELVRAGDIVSFQSTGSQKTDHIGVVAGLDGEDGELEFMHSWHQSGHFSGVRSDRLRVDVVSGQMVVLPPGVPFDIDDPASFDQSRYESIEFKRPKALGGLSLAA